MSKPVRHLLAGALAAPLLLVAACGDRHAVVGPPFSPSAPSSSASPPQHETPEAFIRRWADADIAMQTSGDSALFRKMSERCRDCIALADRVDGMYTAGGYIHTRGWVIKNVEVLANNDGRISVNLHVRSYPTTYRESAHGPLKRYSGGAAIYQLDLEHAGRTWSVASLARLSS